MNQQRSVTGGIKQLHFNQEVKIIPRLCGIKKRLEWSLSTDRSLHLYIVATPSAGPGLADGLG